MKYGIEKEYFVKKGDKFVLVPSNYPQDECGWLLEIRSKPSKFIEECVDDILAQEQKYKRQLQLDGLTLVESPVEKLPGTLVRRAARNDQKGIAKYRNYLGHEYHDVKKGEYTASVHISFTNETIVEIPKTQYELFISESGKIKVENKPLEPVNRIINSMFDYMMYFQTLDKAFEKEIKDSNRVQGMYELKPDGRIEYRSLPNNINLMKLIETIKNIDEEDEDSDD